MTTPIQLSYLLSLPLPNAVEELSYDTILSERIAGYSSLLPDWSGSTDSPVYKIAETESLREFTLRQIHNNQIRRAFLPFATGSTLRQLALWARYIPGDEEDDNTVKLAIINRIRSSPVTRTGLIALAKVSSVTVLDANVEFSIVNNKWQTTLYALGDSQADLTAQEQVDLLAWMNLSGHTILDSEAIIGAVTKTPLTISVTAYYFPGVVDGTTLAVYVRDAIYNWINENSRLGNTIRKRDLESASKVAGVRYVDASVPANDEYIATDGQVYTFIKDNTNVVVNVTAL